MKLARSSALIMVLLFWLSPAAADDDDRRHHHDDDDDEVICVDIEAAIEASFSTGCDSVYGFCTEGVISDRRGWLDGSTSASLQGLGGGVVGEPSIVTPEAVEPGTTWSYGGVFVVTTRWGMLYTDDIGVYDTAIGAFSEVTRVTGGTGVFENASGILFAYGLESVPGVSFESTLTGELCFPRSNLKRKKRRSGRH